uniref:Thioredoxin domain-containing protein n=1 Tax=viral metagenome TaxID=1070528 RepID=A0A6C0F291_9ZZZZ
MEFLEAKDQSEVKRMMKEVPIIVFFHSSTCPHCVNTMPHWKEMCANKEKYGLGDTKMIAVGDSAIPDDAGVTGVPHFRKISKSGKVTDIKGSKDSVDELVKSLKKMDGGSRRTRRRHTRRLVRRVRKTRHRR